MKGPCISETLCDSFVSSSQAGFDPNEEWNLSEVLEEGGAGGAVGPRLRGVSLGEARLWLSKSSPGEEGERWALCEAKDTLYLGSRLAGGSRTLSKVSNWKQSFARSISQTWMV